MSKKVKGSNVGVYKLSDIPVFAGSILQTSIVFMAFGFAVLLFLTLREIWREILMTLPLFLEAFYAA